MTWSAQLSWRSPPRLSRWRRCFAARGVDRACACERGERCLASHPAGVAAGDEQLCATDRPQTALLEQSGRDFGDERSEGALSFCELPRESLDAPAEPPQNAVPDLGVGPQPSRRAGESLPGERSQTRTRVIGRSHHQSAQLIEGGVARLHRATTLEQEQAQVLAPTTAAGNAQAFAAEQAAPQPEPHPVRSLLPRRRSCRRGRSHSYTLTPARSRKRTSPAP
jgi:hypothetical protein